MKNSISPMVAGIIVAVVLIIAVVIGIKVMSPANHSETPAVDTAKQQTDSANYSHILSQAPSHGPAQSGAVGQDQMARMRAMHGAPPSTP